MSARWKPVRNAAAWVLTVALAVPLGLALALFVITCIDVAAEWSPETTEAVGTVALMVSIVVLVACAAGAVARTKRFREEAES